MILYETGPPWSLLLYSFRLSKHERYRVFFHWSRWTKHWETCSGNEPLLSQVCEIYGNELIFGLTKTSVCYPLWTHKNKKEALIDHDGEIKGRESFCKIEWQLFVTFEHGTCLHIIHSIGYLVDLQVDPLSWVMSLWFKENWGLKWAL